MFLRIDKNLMLFRIIYRTFQQKLKPTAKVSWLFFSLIRELSTGFYELTEKAPKSLQNLSLVPFFVNFDQFVKNYLLYFGAFSKSLSGYTDFELEQ